MCLVTRPLLGAEFEDRDGKIHAFTMQILEVARVPDDEAPRFHVAKFLRDSQSRRGYRQLFARIDRVARNGARENGCSFKHISHTDGIFEFRAGQLRLFCFQDGNMVVCTNGLFKQENETDRHAIKTASEWKEAYFKAKNTGKLRHE
jgi:hypothetical protein